MAVLMSKKLPINIKKQKRPKLKSPVSAVLVSPRNEKPISVLHRFVYTSNTSFCLTLLLLLSFFFQGVSVVFANGDEAVETVLVTSSNTLENATNAEPILNAEGDLVSQAIDVPSSEPEDINDDMTDSEDVLLEDNANDTLVDMSLSTTTSPETVTNIDVGSTSLNDIASSTEVDTNYSPATTTDELTASSTVGAGASSSTATTTEESSDESTHSFDEISTSTVVEGPAIETPVGVNYSDSGFTFSKDQCTELANGSFYCLEPTKNILSDGLFAGLDQDGDLEIYLLRNGVQTQITNNEVDDASPFYDQNSESIVWHRLINDRYQIISYDINTGQEQQLTYGSTNNMEPMRQGKYTVWQRWTDDNWDIVMFDGVKETQITHTKAHDIAPYIHGSLIVWNQYSTSGEKTIEMYDISTGTYVTVDDPAGLSVTNPRMVLVYDQMHPNGDVITKGYDLIAKRFIQLDTLPRQLPLDIPKSEPTHETRALIQSKPNIKGDEVKNNDINPNPDPVVPPAGDNGTSTDMMVLNLSTTTNNLTSPTPTSTISDFDLIIESSTSTTEGL